MTDDDAKMVASLRRAAQLVYDYMSPYVSSDIEAAAVEFERLAAENARLAAEVERLTLVWSSERPKVVGEYLVRCKSNGLREENLWLDDDDAGVAWDDDWEFAGPIVVREPARGRLTNGRWRQAENREAGLLGPPLAYHVGRLGDRALQFPQEAGRGRVPGKVAQVRRP